MEVAAHCFGGAEFPAGAPGLSIQQLLNFLYQPVDIDNRVTGKYLR
jgi:hypothetical protein